MSVWECERNRGIKRKRREVKFRGRRKEGRRSVRKVSERRNIAKYMYKKV